MDLKQQHIAEFTEALNVGNVMVMLWDPEDRLVYADQKSFDWSEISGGMLSPDISFSDYVETMKIGGGLTAEIASHRIKQRQILRKTGETQKNKYEVSGLNKTLLIQDVLTKNKFVMTTYTDITEMTDAQNTADRLAQAIEDVPNGVMLWDENDILLTINQAVRQITNKQGSYPKPGMSFKEVYENEYNAGLLKIKNNRTFDLRKQM